MSERLDVQCPACYAVLPKDHPYGWCATCGAKLPYDVLRALRHPAVTPPGGSTLSDGERHLTHDSHPLPEVDVLIVEDHAPIRSVMRRVLEEAGYSVEAVENGLVALAAVQESRYRAIICDLGMPLVDGMRFYEYLASGFPALAKRVLFVTAIADTPPVVKFLTRTGRPALQKPFEIRALVRAVAQLVDRPPTPGALL